MRCDKCGCTNFYTEIKGSQIGLYCRDCNKWVKWFSKKDYEASKRTGNIVVMSKEEHSKIHGTISEGRMKAQLERLVFYIEKEIYKEMSKEPLSVEDSIRKSSYCLALERDKNAISDILQGKDFAEMQ